MTVAEYVPLVWLKFKGKGRDKAPTAGPKWQNILDITNMKLQNKWATDPKQNWSSLFRVDTYPLSTSVDLNLDVAKVVDTVTLVNGDQRKDVPLVQLKDRNKPILCAYQNGSHPKKLSFNQSVPSQFVGGTVEVPINFLPPVLTQGVDDIICDNMAWLIAEVSADLSFKKPHFGNLVNEANDEYDKMCEANNPEFGAGAYVENGYGSFF